MNENNNFDEKNVSDTAKNVSDTAKYVSDTAKYVKEILLNEYKRGFIINPSIGSAMCKIVNGNNTKEKVKE